MAVPFIVCPSCDTLLLPDTVRCPACRHVLNEQRLRELGGDLLESLPDKAREETECPHCQEMVKNGLVRCWGCSSFMREDIAQAYQRLQARPREFIYSQRAEVTTAKSGADDQSTYQLNTPASDVVEPVSPSVDSLHEEDFQLDESVASSMSASQVDQAQVDQAPTETSGAESTSDADIPEMTDSPSDEEAPQSKAAAAKTTTAKTTAAETTDDAQGEDTQDKTPHSEATGGDVLLQIALDEESEAGQPRMARRLADDSQGPVKGKLRIYCPNGHRIDVSSEFRGRVGRCPKCKARYIVPDVSGPAQAAGDQPDESSAATPTEGQAESYGSDQAIGEYRHWTKDVHVHVVDPAKLKLKPGSLVNEFVPTDLGFASSGLLLATLQKKGGLFGSGGKKASDVRDAVLEYLRQASPLEDLPAAEHDQIPPEAIETIRVEQPNASPHESIFAGIPVFGEGRIAIRLPQREGETTLRFASFTLTEFRKFIDHLTETFGPAEFASASEIPLADAPETLACHYSEEEMQVLQQPEFYLADPQIETKLAGYRCQECGLVVSEDSRKKERIGGRAGKGIAKAKCPKCSKPFGNLPLHSLVAPAPSDAEAEKADGE